MGVRQALQNPVVGGTVAAVVIVLAIVLYFALQEEGGGARKWPTVYTYMDLSTGKMFEDQVMPKVIPPIPAPSGATVDGEPAGVLAWQFGCGGCEETFTGYLEKWTPEAKLEWAKPAGSRNDEIMAAGRLIRAVDGGDWYVETSDEAIKIMASPAGKCTGKRLIKCTK